MTQLGRVRPSEALALHRGALRQLLNRYGFRQPRDFGSVLTRTDTEESDLDVLVEPVRGTTLFTLACLEDEALRILHGRQQWPPSPPRRS